MGIKFIIIGAPRTGSTLLVKTLNTLDGVLCHGELLGMDAVRGYEDGVDLGRASKRARDERARRLLQERNDDPASFIAKALDSGKAASGFKTLYGALLNPHWKTVVVALLQHPDMRFIHLRRENSLRRFVSEEILLAGGAIHSGLGGRSDITMQVHVDIDAFLKRDAQLTAQMRKIEAMLSQKPVLDISYEALSNDVASCVRRVTNFLGLPAAPVDVRPALSKVGAADLRDTVSNYQELLDHPATRTLLLAD